MPAHIKSKPMPIKKGAKLYKAVILLIAPPGLLSVKTIDVLTVNFEYKTSKVFKKELFEGHSSPSNRPLLVHVYTLEGDLISELPEVMAAMNNLHVVVYGFSPNGLSNAVGNLKH